MVVQNIHTRTRIKGRKNEGVSKSTLNDIYSLNSIQEWSIWKCWFLCHFCIFVLFKMIFVTESLYFMSLYLWMTKNRYKLFTIFFFNGFASCVQRQINFKQFMWFMHEMNFRLFNSQCKIDIWFCTSYTIE